MAHGPKSDGNVWSPFFFLFIFSDGARFANLALDSGLQMNQSGSTCWCSEGLRSGFSAWWGALTNGSCLVRERDLPIDDHVGYGSLCQSRSRIVQLVLSQVRLRLRGGITRAKDQDSRFQIQDSRFKGESSPLLSSPTQVTEGPSFLYQRYSFFPSSFFLASRRRWSCTRALPSPPFTSEVLSW